MNTFRLLLLTLFVAAMPIMGFAYTGGQIVTFNQLWYKVLSPTSHTLAFIGTNGFPSGPLTLPNSVFDGKDATFTITELQYEPGYACYGVTELTIPETVKTIGAFSVLWAPLIKVHIPQSVTNISESAFCCLNKAPKFTVASGSLHFEAGSDGALYSKGKTKLYSVPSDVQLSAGGVYNVDNNVKRICIGAFLKTNGLKKVVLPNGLQSIDMGMFTIAPTASLEAFEVRPGGSTPFSAVDGVLFKGDELVLYPQGKPTQNYVVPNGIKKLATYSISDNGHLRSIDLNQVTTLRNSAIYNALELTSITIPKDIKKYGKVPGQGLMEGCFESCPKVSTYYVASGNTDFVIENGVLFSADKTLLYCYPPSKPGSSYAIPNSVTQIGNNAFQNAQFITSIHIPQNVIVIGSSAFRQLSNLSTLTFDANSKVNYISDLAFRGCSKLNVVTLPKGITSLGAVFYECENLEVINVPANSKLTTIRSGAFSTNRKLKAFNFMGECQLNRIGANVFAGLKELTAFSIPKSVAYIDANAFIGCKNLTTVTFDPNAVIQKIGEGAFADCGITNIKIPKKVVEIEREAFLKCEALTTINITKATTSISPEAFKYCSRLTAINVDKDNEVYSSIDGYLLSKNKQELMIFPPGKANERFTLLPPSVIKIGDYAFYDCKKLKNVTIPNKVKHIGKRAFGFCDNLNTITFLCDEIIPAANISQGGNDAAFDADKGATKKMGKITINVRKNKFGDYQSIPFYKKFASIRPSFTISKEEYILVSEKAAAMLSTENADHTFVLPTDFHYGGKKYEVSFIGDYAFEHVSPNVKEVVVKKNVEYIGAKAFVTTGNTLKNVFFIEGNPTKGMLSTTRFDLDATGDNYNEFAPDTKIYVKKSAYNKYKAEWTKTRYNSVTKHEEQSPYNFTNQIDYRIKDVKINTKYATFAREFDVDFKECVTENGSRVAAFVSGSKVVFGKPDYGTATYRIRMTSIDCNGGVSDSYGYVPANTGVLLKVIDNKSTTNADFYYTIGEKDDVQYSIANNVMKGVTVNATKVVPFGPARYYVMQGGSFRRVTVPVNNFPVHKAYLKVNKPAGAKLILQFDDEEIAADEGETVTGIGGVTNDENGKEDDAYYNLNGQRVDNPQKGIYIHRGKKVIIK